MVFTVKEELNGENAARSLSKKAFDAYSGISPLSVYEKETEEGKRYFMDGALEYSNLTFEKMQEIFEAMYDDVHIGDNVWDNIVSYMDDEIREKVHFELAPCTSEQFLLRYLELDPEFEKTMEQQFSKELEKLNLYR